MKAIDTVMDYELKLCHSLIGKFSLSAIKDVVDEECLAQAEITWDKAIKEVVDFVEEHYLLKDDKPASTAPHLVKFRYIQPSETWRAKLKDWGLTPH